jgi:hypothetical protein
VVPYQFDQMNTLELVNLPLISGAPQLPTDLVTRDSVINSIEKMLEQNDIVFIEGDPGIGKTTMLLDFVTQHQFNAISHFGEVNYAYTISYPCLLDNLYRQIYFYCRNEEAPSEQNVDTSLFNSLSGTFFKKIKKSNEPLYFVFDGFEKLSKTQLSNLIPIFDTMPWSKAKFVITGTFNNLNTLLGDKKLKWKDIPLSNFGLNETKLYFKDICADEAKIQEIHKLSDKGFPEKLKEIKLLCVDGGGVDILLNSDDLSEKTDFLKLSWEKVDSEDDDLNRILALVTFNDIHLGVQQISKITGISSASIQEKLGKLSFIEINNDFIKFQTDTFRKLAHKKLREYEDETNSTLIEYFEKNLTTEQSVFNLPNLYQKAKNWEKLTKFYSVDAFIALLEKHRTMGNVHTHFTQGFDASKKSPQKFNEAYFRFALHKSSAKELEERELWESEIEARMSINDYEQAFILANSAFLKEDRLKLLATLAKERLVRNLPQDDTLVDQIKTLYIQIDFLEIPEKAFQIAGVLMYSCFELAIELVEKLSNKTAATNSLDYAYAYLALFATDAKKKNTKQAIDIDVFNDKIQNADIKNLTNALRFSSEKYDHNQIIRNAKSLSQFSHKFFLLKSWILNNQEDLMVGNVIKYTLDEIVKTSTDNVPNAASLSSIATPLSNIKNFNEREELILLFDSQKDLITTPTRDYVILQLTIAGAQKEFSWEKGKDRIFDIYCLIDDLTDLSTKTDCLALLWVWLIKHDAGNLIEESLSSRESIERQVTNNIAKLLKDTAHHFRIVQFAIEQLVVVRTDVVTEIIESLNTQARKDYAYKTAITKYLEVTEVKNIDFNVVTKFYKRIKNGSHQESIIVTVVDKYFKEKGKSSEFIPSLLNYYDLIVEMINIEIKCYVISHAIKILNYKCELYGDQIKRLLIELYKSWDSIDLRPTKIRIAFEIARDLGEFSSEEATKYLQLGTQLKQVEPFSSFSLVNTYINSTRLCIRSFCGLVPHKDTLEKELGQLREVIDQIQAVGKKLELWSELALRTHSLGKHELFKTIYNNYINPLLVSWKSPKNTNQFTTVVAIAPSIYLYNQNIFLKDYLPSLPDKLKNDALGSICDFIITKQMVDDPANEDRKRHKLEYPELADLCVLIEQMDNDHAIYGVIDKIAEVLRGKDQSHLLSPEQKTTIKTQLHQIVNKKFPVATGIRHEGYKIVSEVELLSLEPHRPDLWANLIRRTKLISNISDRALIMAILTSRINHNSKAKKIELMDETFELIKSIPSVYDKTNRFDATWSTILDIEKTQFKKFLNIAFQDLLRSKDPEVSSLRNLIDMAQQHDPKLAESCVTLLDQDPSRKKLKEPLLRRIKNNSIINTAVSKSDHLDDLNPSQFERVFYKKLEEQNSGRVAPEDLISSLRIIDSASNLSISDAFNAYIYFIQNANRQIGRNKKELYMLDAIFLATIENTKLIAILSSDNIDKMKNLYRASEGKSSERNPIISAGEREKALEFIKKWLPDHVQRNMYIIDPYFTENDLDLLLTYQELMPDSKLVILTSKKDKNNSHKDLANPGRSQNKEVYMRAWKKISSQTPTNVTIKVVWDKDTFECPFHDRWYVSGDAIACLHIGTSVNGLGHRDSQIIELIGDQLIDISKKIDQYIWKEQDMVGGFNLRYERFDFYE